MIYRFADFSLDAGRYELQRDGESLAAEPKVLEVLAFLASRPGRVVSKEELHAKVWEGRFVGDAAIGRAVREARKLLAQGDPERQWIKTVYGRGYRFEAEVETIDPSAEPPPTGGPKSLLPRPLTSLVGREEEIEEVCRLLEENRLVTLSGAAGTGKSRLALAVAEAVARRFPDGVYFVPLAELDEPTGLLPTLARALELTDAAAGSTLASLQMQLDHRRILLVLDNFERLLAAADDVVELLHSCAHVHALVTSRFVLRVEGEQEFSVPPLALPRRGGDDAGLAAAPAVALFLDRARSVLPSFDPDFRELSYVAEICRRLDGLPLAIEWAAARIKIFPPKLLWERLAGRLDLLGSRKATRSEGKGKDRHRTLEEAVAWSTDLLADEESGLLRRLSVFVGGFPLSAVDSVCGAVERDEAGDLWDGVELIAALVDKSLLEPDTRHPAGAAAEPRFRLLETTREHARALLHDAGEEQKILRRHARWALELAIAVRDALVGGGHSDRRGDQAEWLGRLDADYANLIAAMERSWHSGDTETAWRIGAALTPYWSSRGLYREGWARLRALLPADDAAVDSLLHADILSSLGLLALLRCEYHRARDCLERARTLLETSDDKRRLARVLDHLAWIGVQIEPSEETETLARRAREIHTAVEDTRGVAVSLNNLAHLAFFHGDLDTAERRFADSLARRLEVEDQRGVAFALLNRVMCRLVRPAGLDETDEEEIGSWLGRAGDSLRHLSDPPLEGWLACMQALWQLELGDAEAAARGIAAQGFTEAEVPHPDGIAWAAVVAGRVQVALGHDAEAERRYAEAYEIWCSIGSVWGRAFGALHLAAQRRRRGDEAGAHRLEKEARELATRWQLDAVVDSVVEACRRLGDERR